MEVCFGYSELQTVVLVILSGFSSGLYHWVRNVGHTSNADLSIARLFVGTSSTYCWNSAADASAILTDPHPSSKSCNEHWNLIGQLELSLPDRLSHCRQENTYMCSYMLYTVGGVWHTRLVCCLLSVITHVAIQFPATVQRWCLLAVTLWYQHDQYIS